MLRSLLSVVCCAAIVGAPFAAAGQQLSSPGPAATATQPPIPPPSSVHVVRTVAPAIVARAKEWEHRLSVADIDRSQLDSAMSTMLTDSFAANVSAKLAPLGEPRAFWFIDERNVASNSVYRFRVIFPAGTLIFIFALDTGGKISALRLVPQH